MEKSYKRDGGEQIISKEKRIKELERQRRQYLNDYNQWVLYALRRFPCWSL
ncbi:MAG: hypothetical protein J6O04_05020 [Selenomonadaceae bacterium]|nr:hypothetical protein [Selenomonadaceae bacterium]